MINKIKTIIFCLLISVLALSFSACNSENNNTDIETTLLSDSVSISTNAIDTENKTTQNNETTNKNIETINTTKTDLGIGGASISTRKYRVNYYDVPYQFVLLVGEDAYWEWDEQHNIKDPDKTNIMVMKSFIEYFDISREDFDKANLEWTKVIYTKMGGKPAMNPKDFANQETDEPYNADIIYTFDDNLINEYYISGYYPFIFESDYEEAVLNGTHQTLTTDWIDIEQMEAEIIAKYGEAEIVTEQETTTAEAVTTDLPQTETIE